MAANARSGVDAALIEIGRALPSGAVVTDRDVCEAYSRDESETPPVVPDAVVRARSTSDVVAVMRAASAHRVPVTPRSGGTGRTGGAVPVAGGIVLAFEGMEQILEIDRDDLVAVVEPGVVTGALHEAVQAEGLFYPPDPNSLGSCRMGGNVAENAGGPRAFKYGVTREYVLGLEVVTARGVVLELGKRTVKGVTGYDLTALVVGSEGTLAVVTRATVSLLPLPERVVTMLVLLPDMAAVGRAVTAATASRVVPRCVELLDEHTLALVRPLVAVSIPADARAMLLVELDGDEKATDAELERCGAGFVEAGALDVLVARHGGEREKLWAARRELSHALRRTAKYKLSEDIVVPRSQLAVIIERVRGISERTGVRMPTYGHAGDGNLHVNFLWDDPAERPTVEKAIEALFREVVALRGTLSGEHGIGVLKAPYLPLEQSAELIALQEQIKSIFDPGHILNPGKIFPADARRYHQAC